MKEKTDKLAVVNIGLLATPLGREKQGGENQGRVSLVEDAYLLVEGGIIAAVNKGQTPNLHDFSVIDAQGCLVTPGLVDAHTHLVFGGWRAHEMAQKIAGVPYLDILKQGGGILDTVSKTREAGFFELKQKAEKALDEMLSFGTTACEAKSGYGLDLENELKQLQVAKSLSESHPVSIVSTLMAAHALPKEFANDRAGYLSLVINTIIPAVAKENLAAFCDVFCEEGVFSKEEAGRVLKAGQEHGLKSKIHADEIHPIGGSELASELKAVSAEHLIAVTDSGIAALKEGGVVACLLPATSLYLGKPYAPAQKLMEAGVPIAIGSDFNPGSCPSLNLQLCMTLATLYYRMTPEQVLTAVTLNAAAAIGMADSIGSLEAGKQADLVIWDAPDLDYLCYRLGSNLVKTVIKNGELVLSAEQQTNQK